MNRLILCLVLLVCGSVPAEREAVAQTGADVQVAEILTIGANRRVSADYLLGDPVAVQTDASGRIYVFDQAVMQAKVYDRRGKFLRALGGRGRGEGQFNHLTSAAVAPDGSVVVADQMNGRITRLSGRRAETFDLNDEAMLWPRQMLPLGDDYLVLYRMPEGDRFFHVWDRSFRQAHATFGALSDYPAAGDPFAELYTLLDPGHFWLTDASTVVFAPALYDGRLLRYRRQGNRWSPIAALTGDAGAGAAFERVPAEEFGSESVTVMRGAQPAAARVRVTSAGVFALRDGGLVHFTSRRGEQGASLYVERFDRDGRFLGASRLAAFEAPGHRKPWVPVTVNWKDAEDRFYVIDRRRDPVVRVVRLDFGR